MFVLADIKAIIARLTRRAPSGPVTPARVVASGSAPVNKRYRPDDVDPHPALADSINSRRSDPDARARMLDESETRWIHVPDNIQRDEKDRFPPIRSFYQI